MLHLLLAMAVTVALSARVPTVSDGLSFLGQEFFLGEVLYAVAAYLAWAMLLGRKSPLLIAVIAFACCLAVELFKLTGIPAKNQDVFLVRWFLGMTFDAVNLVYYFIGARVLTAFADYVTRGSKRGEKTDRESN